ncbi:hypothetical protein [Rhizobium rhizogenes]|uniref:hypothetical protein n=1 Tax=Rhizobium rhizogenes TaxID=359 RepID=UPI0022C6E902|nr:hypothetical protein [Rhizobium rhizogenes]MCZ7466398.1 hypothetical protein [Rhizobium rhizogenes]
MGWDVKNYWVDIAEVRIDDDVTNSEFSAETELRLELYTGSMELDLEERSLLVGFSRLTLQLECHGTDIVIGNRLGDQTPDNSQTTKTSIQTDTKKKSSFAGGLGFKASSVSAADANFSAGAESSKTTAVNTETTRITTSNYVTAKPNGKWDISTPDATPLGAKFIAADVPLCSIKPKTKSNRSGVIAHLYAHKRDIVVTDNRKSLRSKFGGDTRNKEKVLAILIGKDMTAKREGLDEKNYIQLSHANSMADDV